MDNLAYSTDHESYELINGQVYMIARPSSNHMTIELNIATIFKNYLKGKKCRPFNETDLFLSKNDNFVPDVMIVCDPAIIKDDGIHGIPELVVEILSPSTAIKDRGVKFQTYEKCGVKEYWIVSPEAKSVEVYLLKNGKFEFDYVYSVYPAYEWAKLSEKHKLEAKFEIKVSLYDDFYVKLDDIFEYVN